jgi:hypothetical protein
MIIMMMTINSKISYREHGKELFELYPAWKLQVWWYYFITSHHHDKSSSCLCYSNYSFFHSLTHSLYYLLYIHSLTLWTIHSHTLLLIHSLIHSLTHWPFYSIIISLLSVKYSQPWIMFISMYELFFGRFL